MKSKKKLTSSAKFLFRKSLTEGAVDSKKVRAILSELKTQYKAGLTGILKAYKKLIATAINQEEITLETGEKFVPPAKFEDELLAKTGAKRISFKVNSKLVFGARITHGDWIYDAGLPAKLSRITMNDSR